MPRKPRIEIGGDSISSSLAAIIAEGSSDPIMTTSSSRHSERQKTKLPFFLYTYCLIPNLLHLLIEMQDDPLSPIMQRVLTTYSQYHNRKYKEIGHLWSSSRLCGVRPTSRLAEQRKLRRTPHNLSWFAAGESQNRKPDTDLSKIAQYSQARLEFRPNRFAAGNLLR